jgi:phosphoribosyl-dephospho-CoA transferase
VVVVSADERVPRHTFICVDADALSRHGPWAPDPATAEFVLAWFSEQRPAICTRSDGRLPRGLIAAGIATLPAQGKKRIAFTLPRSAVMARVAPPTLREVAVTCTLHRSALAELARRAEAADLQLSVFGSFAWQHFTGLNYVTERSDLDVLWRPRHAHELQAGIDLLARWESEFGLRADGEAVFPNEDAVCWREWAMSSDTLLVKNAAGARLLGRNACLTAWLTHDVIP